MHLIIEILLICGVALVVSVVASLLFVFLFCFSSNTDLDEPDID